MREILFRGKRKNNGEWVYGDLRYLRLISTSIYDAVSFCSIDVDPETVGQYTGLKDCNGKRIFEGDIIKAGRNTFDTNISIVTFYDGAFQYQSTDKIFLTPFAVAIANGFKFKVVGNKWDNPELLKEVNIDVK